MPPGLIKSSFVIFRFTSEFSGRIPFCRGEFAPGRSVNLSENSVRADQEFCFNFSWKRIRFQLKRNLRFSSGRILLQQRNILRELRLQLS